jgi:hypothetical protein
MVFAPEVAADRKVYDSSRINLSLSFIFLTLFFFSNFNWAQLEKPALSKMSDEEGTLLSYPKACAELYNKLAKYCIKKGKLRVGKSIDFLRINYQNYGADLVPNWKLISTKILLKI